MFTTSSVCGTSYAMVRVIILFCSRGSMVVPQDHGCTGRVTHCLRVCSISQGHAEVLRLVLVDRIDISLVLWVPQ